MEAIQQFYLKKYNTLNQEFKISKYCTIRNGLVSVNGVTVFSQESTNFNEFIKAVYKKFEMNYPKFFKMDSLSKLTFVASELILKEVINSEVENNIALLFANQSSSLDTDIKYQDSIQDYENYFPSPAVFVYTLPNICIGEVSIKNNLKSENSFFIFDKFSETFFKTYAEQLIQSKKAEKVLCGWVEVLNNEYHSFVYLVEKEGSIEHNEKNIKKINN